MDGVEQLDYSALYNKTVADPSAVDEKTLSILIDRYPYAQSLRFIRARKLYEENREYNMDDVLLYTGSLNWLQGYLIEGPSQPEDTEAADVQPAAEPADAFSDVYEHPAGIDY